MTTDILIPLGKGSRHDNLELKYCLRSIEKHLSNVGDVVIVGEKPEWLQNIIHVPAKDSLNNWQRANNIYKKIMVGINWVDETLGTADWSPIKTMSDNFLFMNDDHFLLRDYVAAEFPYYHKGVIDLWGIQNNQPQLKQMTNTVLELNKNYGIEHHDFDIHCPIVYNKKLFVETFNGLKWPEYGYGIKTMYSNKNYMSLKILAECEDLKFHEPLMKQSIYQALEGRGWFSIGDRCLKSGAMKEVLQELYPNKSKYEA